MEIGDKEVALPRTFNPNIQAARDSQCPIRFYKEFSLTILKKLALKNLLFILPSGKIGKFMTKAAKQAKLDVSDVKDCKSYSEENLNWATD